MTPLRDRLRARDRPNHHYAEVERNLFRPFVSAKDAGMGLGLSICQTIIEAHNGKIWLGKPNEGGTAFHFTLSAAGEEQ